MWGILFHLFFCAPDFSNHFFTCTIALSPPRGPILSISLRLLITTSFTLLPSPSLWHPLPLRLDSNTSLTFLVVYSSPWHATQFFFVHVLAGSRCGVAVSVHIHMEVREWHTGDFRFPESSASLHCAYFILGYLFQCQNPLGSRWTWMK